MLPAWAEENRLLLVPACPGRPDIYGARQMQQGQDSAILLGMDLHLAKRRIGAGMRKPYRSWNLGSRPVVLNLNVRGE